MFYRGIKTHREVVGDEHTGQRGLSWVGFSRAHFFISNLAKKEVG